MADLLLLFKNEIVGREYDRVLDYGMFDIKTISPIINSVQAYAEA